MSFRDRIAALPKGAKIAGILTSIVAVGGATVAGIHHFSGKRREGEHKGHGHHGHDHGHGEGFAGAHADAHGGSDGLPANPGAMVVVTDPEARRHHIHGHPLRVLLHPGPRRIESDIAVRRDIARLLEDVRRAKHGEPPLAGAGAVIGGIAATLVVAGAGAVAGAAIGAKVAGSVGFVLGAYVAEALMGHGVIAQMPGSPKPSNITSTMTEKDGKKAFRSFLLSSGKDDDDKRIDIDLAEIESSGIKFWAEPGTDKKITAESKARPS